MNRRTPYCLLILLCLAAVQLRAQSISGRVLENGQGVEDVGIAIEPGEYLVLTDSLGNYLFQDLLPGHYVLTLTSRYLLKPANLEVVVAAGQDIHYDFEVEMLHFRMPTVEIAASGSSVDWLRAVDGMGIYAARKCELINMDQLTANLSTNNARQAFNRVAGLNIWENDGGGLQLGIGGRGLSPNRSSNFNTRQNGYDIAADALGYPEAYYSPPLEALQRIEVVRGAASLQYGTQFGGMVNFVFKEGPQDRKFQFRTRQTGGSYGYLGSFNSIGGQVGKVNYYAFYQGKRGNGWRENSGFGQHTAYGSVKWAVSPKLKLGAEYTFMHYLAQQAGGLTDAMFARDPRQSIRDRNWFRVDWNLAALTADVKLADDTKLNLRGWGLYARRDALGFLGAINRIDPLGQRDLITGDFKNVGAEARVMHKYNLLARPAALLVGARYYQGRSALAQGLASDGSGPDFQLLNPEQPEGSDYVFPSRNVSLFAEQFLHLGERWTLTPGARLEYIHTASEGSYAIRTTDLAGNILYAATVPDTQARSRTIALAGLGLAYKPSAHIETYASICRNYRAITFNDMRVANPNFEIDPDLHDERGFNADLGLRGQVLPWLSVDASAFLLYYRDRIGQVLVTDPTTFRYYRLRTNVADSRNVGLECYTEADLISLLKLRLYESRLALFGNVAWIDARYVRSANTAIDGNWVELVPRVNVKAGVDFKHKGWQANVQWTYVAQQYSDATNAEQTPSAVEGIIPAYHVVDASAGYTWRWLSLEASCNNALNARYFTRRAAAYPGPGIIPSDGRSFFVTVGVRI